MKKYSELILVFVVSLTFAVLNQLQVITQWFASKPETLFTGISHYFADYFLYVDQFAQGATGKIFTDAHFTNEPMPATWIYWFNALLGLIGSKLGLNPFATYNLSLFLLVTLLCFLWFYLSKLLYPNNRFARLTCWLLILSASSFWDLGKFFSSGKIELLGQFWFSPTPAFNRLGGVPHQVFQTILFVSLIILLSRLILNHIDQTHAAASFWSIGFLIILVLLAATANPIQMLLFMISLILFYLSAAGRKIFEGSTLMGEKLNFRWWKLEAEKIFLHAVAQDFSIILVVIITGTLGALITNLAFNLPVLTVAKVWENSQNVSVSFWDFFLSVGPVAPFFLIGLIPFFKKSDPLRRLIGIYGILSLVFFFSPIPKLLGTTNVRYLHPAPYAIFAIMATEGILVVNSWFSTVIKKNFTLYTLNFALILLTLPSLYVQIDGRANPKYNDILTSNLNHVPNSVVKYMNWVKNQKSTNPVVLMDPDLPYDVLVPVLTGKTSFTGHPLHTLYPGVKEALRNKFFSETMGQKEIKAFLRNHRIGWIITNRQLDDDLPFLKIGYSDQHLTIFPVSTLEIIGD